MKRCSILLLCALSASAFAKDKALSPNYRDYFTVNFENVAPQAQKISSQGSLTVENLQCANNQCTFDLYGGNGKNDTGVATLFFGDRSAGFCGAVIPDGSKTTDLKMYPVCLDAKASPLRQRANSHEYSFTVRGGSTPIPPNPPQKYKVGDLAEGGVVIDVDSTGEHGVVAANQDVMFTSTTNHQEGAFEEAVNYCSSLNSDTNSDWRVPNIQELGSLDLNKKLVGPLSSKYLYWSSSVYCESCQPNPYQASSKNLWAMSINPAPSADGQRYPLSITQNSGVGARCVRSF